MTINEIVGVVSVSATILVLMIRLKAIQTKIKQTLFPNGGSSLADKINDMKIEMSKLQRHHNLSKDGSQLNHWMLLSRQMGRHHE